MKQFGSLLKQTVKNKASEEPPQFKMRHVVNLSSEAINRPWQPRS